MEMLPVLLHTSVLLFYIGLIDFLLHINHTVAFTMLAPVALCVLVYFVMCIMQLYFHNSPYHTPLSAVLAVFHVRDPASRVGGRRRHRTAFELNGPWSKVFASDTDTEKDRSTPL